MSCTYYEFKEALFGGDYYCNLQKKEVCSDIYYKYCRNYSYDECPIYKNNNNSTSCFITTIACQILGKKDDDEILNNFRNFRDNILQKEEKYHDILKEYDVIGPIIADCIIKDKDNQKLAQFLYQNIMLPINNKIINKDYDKAVEMYYLMTLSLVNYYKLKHNYNQLKDTNYNNIDFNPKTAGHGLRKIKQPNR